MNILLLKVVFVPDNKPAAKLILPALVFSIVKLPEFPVNE